MSDAQAHVSHTGTLARLGRWAWVQRATLLAALVFSAVFGAWLILTPGGVLGKADAVGYAICHRIDGRSFHVHDRQLPMCSRDTGIYLGVLVAFGFPVLVGRAKAGRLPPVGILATLLGFVAIMAVDGLNSYSHFFEGAPHLYTPRNWLRLVTGTFHGLAFGSLVFPIFGMTVWQDFQRRATIRNFKELGGLVVVCAAIIGLVLLEIPAILYPVAVLTALAVLAILTLINSVIVVTLMGRENSYTRWRDLALPLFIALTLAFLELGAISVLRYALTGTWAGFNL